MGFDTRPGSKRRGERNTARVGSATRNLLLRF